MARSPLFRTVRRLLRLANAKRLGIDPTTAPTGPSRRDVFRGALATAALAPLVAACGDNASAINNPPIAIVGGGIAGLSCAYFLKLAGVRADVFEASMRFGGRMYTQREGLDGQLCELGGELVDSDHVVMQALAQTLGLQLDDLISETADLTQDIFHIAGSVQPDATIVAQFEPVAAKMATAVMMGDAD
ncbi:MAG: FAD-dependent oxidoreductase, partial [Proteobacteria bacterium]|nr:FAD-dependent oxidoreductase [Pseudomonadota bacterium]